MTVKQAAERLEISATGVYGLLLSGRLKHYRIGSGRGVYRIAEEHIRDYLASVERRVPPPVPAAPASRVKLRHLDS